MKNLYIPNSPDLFKLSRSKLELFIRCPFCFYLDRRLGIKHPSIPQFTLNNAVDGLLKKECDIYRAEKRPHPLAIEYMLDAIPYVSADPNLIKTWQTKNKGLSFDHLPTNFRVQGIVDDVWVTSSGDLIIIEYKAKAKKEEISLDKESYRDEYKRQVELYAWLFRMNGYSIFEKAYFIFTNGIQDKEKFENCLTFKTVLIEHLLDTSWVDDQLIQAHLCLNQAQPPKRGLDCDYCAYLDKVEALNFAPILEA